MSKATPRACAIEVSRGATYTRVALRGDADLDAVDALGAALSEVHARAIADRCAEVIVDISQLEFMNSTCLKKIITWLGSLEALAPESRYRVRFLSDPTIRWQMRSLHALESFSAGLVTVERS